MALKPENPVVGGTVLRRQAIESPNYVPGVSGWTIKQDGSAEFNNVTLRGTLAGPNFTISPAAGIQLFNGVADIAFFFGLPTSGELPGVIFEQQAGQLDIESGGTGGGDPQAAIFLLSQNAGGGISQISLSATEAILPGATFTSTAISAPGVTSINFDTATIDLANGNLNTNMADPPNTAAVIAGTATQAQYNACLGGMLNSMKNRKFFA